MKTHDTIILGAGLSGLACALTLQKKGIKSLLIEPENVVGGRVQSQVTESGFVIDRGFQVLLSSYPEFENFVELDKLKLKNFHSGALVYNGEALDLLANPIVHPANAASTFFLNYLSFKDKLLVLKLIVLCQFQRTDFPLGNKSTLHFLKNFGFSEKFIDFFWSPFIAGVYLDSNLNNGENFFKFLIRSFGSGRVSIPENGMRELPLQMAAQLPKESVFLGHSARSWSSSEVILMDGTVLSAKKVVCSFTPSNGVLSETVTKKEFYSVETFYFTSERLKEMNWGKWLVLIPQKLGLGINHFCLLTEVAKSYSRGEPLLSVSVIGNKNLPVSQVQQELNLISKRDLRLELVERVFVEKALPQFSEELTGFKVIDGVVYCGDSWASPSINGALRSGRMSAEFILQDNKK